MDEFFLIKNILIEFLGEPKRTMDSQQQQFNCPHCSYDIKGLEEGDGKYNLEVNYAKNVFKCWSCEADGTHGSIIKLVKKWGNKSHLKKLLLILPEEFIPQERKYETVQLPKEFIKFSECTESFKLTHYYKKAFNYLKSRSITEEHIQKYNIGFCYEGMYHDRIIIPSYDCEKQLNYFIARSYIKDKLKYKNPEAEKDKIIFNEFLIDWEKDLFLVEGAFDAMFLSNGIPMLGKGLTELLWNKIYELAKADVYILLDGDAWKDAERLYWRLNGGKLFGRVKLIKLPFNKDIADLKGKYDKEWILELEKE